MPNKTCNKCGQEKSVEFFAKRKDSKDGYRATCKTCVAAGTKAPVKKDKPAEKDTGSKTPTLQQLAKAQGKTFTINPDDIIITWEDNIRQLDEDHAAGFADSFMEGKYVPPILVKKTPNGYKLVAGYHRCKGFYIAAGRDGGEYLLGLEAMEYKGGADSEVATMLLENDGKPLTGLERASAYARLRGMNWDINRIAAAVNRSRSDVEKHLILSDATEPVKQLVMDGTISVHTAIEFVRKYGDDAHVEITKQLAKQAGVGGKPAKRTPVKPTPKFPNKSAQKVLDLIGEKVKVDNDYTDDERVTIFAELTPEEWAELDPILEAFKTFLDEQENI